MPTHIHSTAIVSPKANLGENVIIGAFSVVHDNVQIGDDTVVHSFAVLGDVPQDKKYKGESTQLIIGARNVIREQVTMHRASNSGSGATKIGDDNWFMVGSHVAHDCVIGNGCVLANNATLGGHVQVGNRVTIGGLSAVHQNVQIGELAMIGGMTGVENDVIPFGLVMGDRARLQGLNLIGLERNGYSKEQINALRGMYRVLFEKGDGVFAERLQRMQAETAPMDPAVQTIMDFINAPRKRQLMQAH